MRLTTVIAIASMIAPAAWAPTSRSRCPSTASRCIATAPSSRARETWKSRRVNIGWWFAACPTASIRARCDCRRARHRCGSAASNCSASSRSNWSTTTERTLNRKLRDLGDQRSAIEDEIASAQAQLKLLEGVVAAPTGSGMNAPPLQTSAIGGLVTTVGSSDAAARQRIRSAKLQLRDLDEQAEKVKADLAKVATARKARTELRASVHASAAGNATLQRGIPGDQCGLELAIRGASGQPEENRGAGAPGAIAAGHGRRLEQHRAHHQHVAAQPQRHDAGADFAVPEPASRCATSAAATRNSRKWW